MKRYQWQFLIPVIVGVLIVGCTSNTQQVLKADQEKNTTKVIAVLPVDNKTPDVKAPLLLRSKVLEDRKSVV
jgi:hypothetical protein